MMSSWNPRQKAGHGNARPRTARTLRGRRMALQLYQARVAAAQRSEIFLRAENDILAQLRKSADHLA